MYSYPRSEAASPISCTVPDPSLHCVCICKSPRRRLCHSGRARSNFFASARVRKSRRNGGTVRRAGGLASQDSISLAMNGPTPCSSVNGRPLASTSAATSGQRKALRAARRNARIRIPSRFSASRASNSAISALVREPLEPDFTLLHYSRMGGGQVPTERRGGGWPNEKEILSANRRLFAAASGGLALE